LSREDGELATTIVELAEIFSRLNSIRASLFVVSREI
jgi:hypothetical protein